MSTIVGPAVMQGGARIILTTGPRHGKSEFISNWVPTWYLNQFQEDRVILASYAAEFAAKWGAKVKENLTENPLVTIPLSKSTKSKKNFMTKLGGGMMTAGMGGPITGSGANLFIIDDPIKNYQDAMSPTIREKHKDWFRSVALTRLEPNASIIILQTRWHADDLSGWLLEGNGDDPDFQTPFQLINMPALCEDDDDILGRKRGEALCPERYDERALASLQKDLGDQIWSALYQQRPYSLLGNIILKSWIQFYTALPSSFEEMVITADLTFKETDLADYTVVQVWGRNGANCYLVDQIRSRMNFPDQMAAIRTMSGRYPEVYLKIIEEAANGAAVISMLKNEILGLVPVKPQTSKEARLAAVSPVFQSGNVYLPNPDFYHWAQVVLDELMAFPSGKNDDTVDALVYGVSHMAKHSSSIQRLEVLGKW